MRSVISWLGASAPCCPACGCACWHGVHGALLGCSPTLLWAGLPEAAAVFLLRALVSQGLQFVSGTGGPVLVREPKVRVLSSEFKLRLKAKLQLR